MAIEMEKIPQIGNITASIGVATFIEQTDRTDKLIELADQAMYQAKLEGRNKVVYAKPEQQKSWQEIALNAFIDILSKQRIPINEDIAQDLVEKLDVRNFDKNTNLKEVLYNVVDAITKTSFAVANDEIHPIMNGICFHFVENGLNIVATDGHRLSKVSLSINPSTQKGFVLPQKSANLLKGVLAKEIGDIDITFDKKFMVFQASAYTMVTRQIEGNYPKYDSVIPQNSNLTAIVNREQLLSSIRRIQVCSNRGSNLIKFVLSSNNLKIMGQDIDFATAGEENLTCSFDGTPLEIGFKSTLVIDMLANMDSDDVEIRLSNQSCPGLFVPVQQKEGVSVIMLAMPMMLS